MKLKEEVFFKHTPTLYYLIRNDNLLLPTAKNSGTIFFLFIRIINKIDNVQEKEILQQTATEQNLALSQLIRLQCKEILNPTYAIIPSLLDAKDLANHNGDKYVKVFLSENEHKKLQLVKKERGIGMSRLIYERLQVKSTPIEIKYETDDIYELIAIITDTYRHLIGVAEGLMRRNTIRRTAVRHLDKEIEVAINETYKEQKILNSQTTSN